MNYETVALWSELISAVLFVVALVLIWNKFITPAVAAAQQNANEKIAQAERHLADAKAALGKMQSEIDRAESDAQAIRQRAVDQAKAESASVVLEAREAGERTVRSAAGELDRARADARVRLRDEFLGKALDLARKEAESRVDAGVNGKLVANFLSTLEHGGRN